MMPPRMHVPDLMFPEVGNILWKKVRRGDLTEEQARRIARLVTMAPMKVHASAPLLDAALEIAVRTGRTVYDSLYVALARADELPGGDGRRASLQRAEGRSSGCLHPLGRGRSWNSHGRRRREF